nr:hypothetical protein CFP56_42436 [Quercus suber]
MTYWCGYADAFCAGVKVAKLGFCEVGNGGPSPPSDQALLLIHIVWLIVLSGAWLEVMNLKSSGHGGLEGEPSLRGRAQKDEKGFRPRIWRG